MDLPTARATRNRIEISLKGLEVASHRRMLKVWRDHWWGEVTGDLDATMATMPNDPTYRTYGSTVMGDGVNFNTAAEARAMYQGMLDAGLMPGGPFEQERWSFGDWGMSLEALFTSIFPGAMLAGHDASLEPAGLYLAQFRMATFHPFDLDRGLMLGEIIYVGGVERVEPADTAMIPTLLSKDEQ